MVAGFSSFYPYQKCLFCPIFYVKKTCKPNKIIACFKKTSSTYWSTSQQLLKHLVLILAIVSKYFTQFRKLQHKNIYFLSCILMTHTWNSETFRYLEPACNLWTEVINSQYIFYSSVKVYSLAKINLLWFYSAETFFQQ